MASARHLKLRPRVVLYLLSFLLAFDLQLCGGQSTSFVTVPPHPKASTTNTWAQAIGAHFKDLLDDVTSRGELKDYYNRYAAPNLYKELNGTAIVEEIAQNWEELLQKKMNALQRAVDHLQQKFEKYEWQDKIEKDEVSYYNAKQIGDLNLTCSEQFRQPVNLNTSVVHIPTDIYEGDSDVLNDIQWTDDLDRIFTENYANDQGLLWQYFGSTRGIMRTYPARNWAIASIDQYDVRRRVWYIQAAASPKDMMILVDISGSVTGMVLELIKTSVTSLIKTLGENDFVNVAWFNTSSDYVSCFKTFVQASERNKDVLKKSVEGMGASGQADFAKGLEFAFQEFDKFENNELKDQGQGANCNKVIMIFTDGGEDKAREVFEKYNKDKQVRVFTYVVGTLADNIDGVKWMACEYNGYYTNIPSVGAIRLDTLNYVPVLGRPMVLSGEKHYMWSNIYLDAMGLGMMTTATLPVYNTKNNQEMLGVMGTDVTIADMEELIPHNKLGPEGYAFGINTNGYILIHPRLKGQLGYLIEPPNVDLLEVEFKTPEKLAMRTNMINKETGNTVTETFMMSQDERYLFLVNMSYYYRGINGTSFSMAIGIPSFNKLDLEPEITPQEAQDSLNDAKISQLFIADWMFCKNVNSSLSNEEMKDGIKEILDGNNGGIESCEQPMFDTLLMDLIVTASWLPKNSTNWKGVFVGTKGGVTRIFPWDAIIDDVLISDLSCEKGFCSREAEDYLERDPWKYSYYERALYLDSESYLYAVPYSPDEYGFNYNVTGVQASQAVRLDYQYTPAVMGATFESIFFHDEWIKLTTEPVDGIPQNQGLSCKDGENMLCYLVDDGGFIVDTNVNRENNGRFFGLVEGAILSQLINNSIYIKVESYDYQASCTKKTDIPSSAPASYLSLSFLSYLPEMLTFGWWSYSGATWTSLVCGVWSLAFHGLPAFAQNCSNSTDDSSEDDAKESCIKLQKQFKFGDGETAMNGVFFCENDDSCVRDWSAARVSYSNLLLVTAEPFCQSTLCDSKAVEIVQESEEVDGPDPCVTSQNPWYRVGPGFCYAHHADENFQDCGRGDSLHASWFLVLLQLILVIATVSRCSSSIYPS